MIKKVKGDLRLSRLCNYEITLVLFCNDAVPGQGIWAVRFLSTQMCKLCGRVCLIMTHLRDNVPHCLGVVAIVAVGFLHTKQP